MEKYTTKQFKIKFKLPEHIETSELNNIEEYIENLIFSKVIVFRALNFSPVNTKLINFKINFDLSIIAIFEFRISKDVENIEESFKKNNFLYFDRSEIKYELLKFKLCFLE